MTIRYTKEQTDTLIKTYKSASTDAERKQVIQRLATDLGKSTKSVISKLSREGAYVRPMTPKVENTSKSQYINAIAIMLDIRDVAQLDSLEKASKQSLKLMSDRLVRLNDVHDVKGAK